MAKTLFVGGALLTGMSFSAASTTSFFECNGGLRQRTSNEARAQLTIREPGVFRKLRVNVATNARTTNTVITFRINGADADQTVTFGSGVTGWQLDTTHEDRVAAGDVVNMKLVTGTGSGALEVRSVIMEYEADNGRISYFCLSFNDAAAWRFDIGAEKAPLTGFGSPTLASTSNVSRYTDNRTDFRAPCTLSHATLNVITMTMNINPVVTLYKNDVATSVTFTVTGPGFYEDTANSFDVASGDYVYWVIDTTGRTSGDMTTAMASVRAEWHTTEFDVIGFIMIGANPSNGNNGWAAGTRYAHPGGRLFATATEAPAEMKLPFPTTITNLRAAAVNNDAAAATFPAVLRVNGAAGNGALTIPNGVAATAITVDTTNSDDIAAEDVIDIETVTQNGTSGLYQVGLTFNGILDPRKDFRIWFSRG